MKQKNKRDKFGKFYTSSNASAPGLVKLTFENDKGEIIFDEIFSAEEWEQIDQAVRSSLGKYRN